MFPEFIARQVAARMAPGAPAPSAVTRSGARAQERRVE
jgi:hypothetical protein